MGLVRTVSIEKSGKVTVLLRLTSPGCMVGVAWFPHQIRTRLEALPGVTQVEVDFDDNFDWSEDDIVPEGRTRLAESRIARLRRLTVVNGSR
jgi:metal-sulfur cluster biosynthetic enzyme